MHMSGNGPPFAGLGAFVLVFLGIYTYSGSIVYSAVIASLLGTAVGLVVSSLTNADLKEFQRKDRARVRQLRKTVDDIRRLNKQVDDGASREAITRACELVLQVIDRTQAKDANSVGSVAASMNRYVLSVHGVLATYVEMQANPDVPGNAELMRAVRHGFQNYRQFALERTQQAQAGAIIDLKAKLAGMQLMTLPDIH